MIPRSKQESLSLTISLVKYRVIPKKHEIGESMNEAFKKDRFQHQTFR